MGFNLDDLWGQAQEKIDEALQTAQEVGWPALKSSLEQWGIDVLTQQNKETQQTLNTNVKAVLDKPDSPPGSLGAAFKSVFQNTFMNQYGVYIIGGVLVVGVLGYMALRKK